MVLKLVFMSFWYILPAYVANASACIFGGGTPIDLKKCFIDGRRVIGDGVTFKGSFFGILLGTLTGAIQGILINFNIFGQLDFYAGIIDHIILAFLLSLGAIVGDAVGSFIKRRLNIERGKPAPLLDQLDFVIGALIFAYPFAPIPLSMVFIIIVMTLFIHFIGNVIAYLIGVKDCWW
ncbi:CDP-2,3-bis-(O-geranylgeranyl)-sn-glycerol synthase [Methanocaldococcus indicus]|uniref:CDP-2,3-bis-(O-geranylgeranyl)-sn-glycerol synthase n=1 Tax=Methanocaldococcus indicus TaxID=213231 RepID=UPI003C6D168D